LKSFNFGILRRRNWVHQKASFFDEHSVNKRAEFYSVKESCIEIRHEILTANEPQHTEQQNPPTNE
jgi:hypothetical protein